MGEGHGKFLKRSYNTSWGSFICDANGKYDLVMSLLV